MEVILSNYGFVNMLYIFLGKRLTFYVGHQKSMNYNYKFNERIIVSSKETPKSQTFIVSLKSIRIEPTNKHNLDRGNRFIHKFFINGYNLL